MYFTILSAVFLPEIEVWAFSVGRRRLDTNWLWVECGLKAGGRAPLFYLLLCSVLLMCGLD